MSYVLLLLVPTFIGRNIETFSVDGVNREAIIVAPSVVTKNPPLVFAFHGHGGTMQGASTLFDVQSKWPEAVVVYPQGLNTPSHVDPQGLHPGWQSKKGTEGNRDIKFFDVAYAKLKIRFHFDEKRVYSMGFSNGAKFSLVLWSACQDRLAAIGEVAGILDDQDKPLIPKPAFLAGGKADTTVPFVQQVQFMKYARTVDGVASNATPNVINGVRHFHGSNDDVAIFIHSGGHIYPPGITKPIVNFFKHHKMP